MYSDMLFTSMYVRTEQIGNARALNVQRMRSDIPYVRTRRPVRVGVDLCAL